MSYEKIRKYKVKDENITYTVKQPSVAAIVASTTNSREAVSREAVDAHHMFSVASLTH